MISSCIIIPLYQKELRENEIISLKQCFRVFKDYSIVFLSPEKYDFDHIFAIIDKSIKFSIETFDDSFFENVTSYSRLLISEKFYERFSGCEYVLIYQLDAFVFKDELPFWTSRGYSYIGAPWFEGYDQSNHESRIIEHGCNGGFSLRHVKSFLTILYDFQSIKNPFRIYTVIGKNRKIGRLKLLLFVIMKSIFPKNFSKVLLEKINIYEDLFWSYVAPVVNDSFTMPRYDKAMKFSFECQPSRLYQMNDNQLPFGCHAWEKYEPDFWKPFIRKIGYDIT